MSGGYLDTLRHTNALAPMDCRYTCIYFKAIRNSAPVPMTACIPQREKKNMFGYTLPESNIAPENRSIPKGSFIFQPPIDILVSGRLFGTIETQPKKWKLKTDGLPSSISLGL